MTEPIRWEDYTGRVRWQPRYFDEVRAYRVYVGDGLWAHRNSGRPPLLYRWHWIAKLVGERERRRRSRQFREYDPAEEDASFRQVADLPDDRKTA